MSKSVVDQENLIKVSVCPMNISEQTPSILNTVALLASVSTLLRGGIISQTKWHKYCKRLELWRVSRVTCFILFCKKKKKNRHWGLLEKGKKSFYRKLHQSGLLCVLLVKATAMKSVFEISRFEIYFLN